MSSNAPRSSAPRSELEKLAWPTVGSELLDVLREAGETREVSAGEVLFDVGQDGYDLIYIETGSIDIVDRAEDHVVVHIEGPNILGELGLLLGQGTFLAGVVAEPSRIIVIPQERLRGLMSSVPELSDLLVRAFSARRRALIEWGEGGLTIVGHPADAKTIRLLEFVTRNRIPHRFIDRADETAMATVAAPDLPDEGAAVITGRAAVLADPSLRELATALGLDLWVDDCEVFDLVIVGAGPAGLAAAVYGASEGLATLAIEDTAVGGQAGTSSRIENYLGFTTGISGTELAYRGQIQAIKFGARVTVPRRAVRLERRDTGFAVGLDDGSTVLGRAVVLANGVQYRRLPIDGLQELEGAGVYYAATELEARVCSGGDVVIVGGGNSAGQAAMFLSRQARHAHIVVRGDGLAATMSSYLSGRIDADPRITLWTHAEVTALHGGRTLEAVTLRNNAGGDEQRVEARGLFVMIGAAPNTAWLDGLVELDEKGFVVTGYEGGPFMTSQPGVFAVGDIRAGSVKRVASAVGEGSVVVSSVHRFLAESATGVSPV